MKVKTIPALQLLLVGAAMLAVSLWLPVLLFAFAGQLILACGLLVFGLALVVAGGVSFRRAKTRVCLGFIFASVAPEKAPIKA